MVKKLTIYTRYVSFLVSHNRPVGLWSTLKRHLGRASAKVMRNNMSKKFTDCSGFERIPLSAMSRREGLPCEGRLLNTASLQSSHDRNIKSPLGCVQPNKNPNPIGVFQEKLTRSCAGLPIRKGAALGIDLGTTSCGLALIDNGRIVFAGVRLFGTSQHSYKGESKQQARRNIKAARARLRRHRQRRSAIGRLLVESGLPDPRRLQTAADPYRARAEGLDRRLSEAEFAAALYNIAKRRGYVPKPESACAGLDGGPGLYAPISQQVSRNEARAAAYRTVGEMLAM